MLLYFFVRLFVLRVNTIVTSLGAQMVKNLPAMRETQVQSWVEKIPWRRECLPTPVFLPGESQGHRSLVSCRLWGYTELNTTEAI